MANYEEVARRWRDRALGIDKRQSLSNPRMPVDGDAIYSYGSHFEIARLIRDRKGQPSHWLINGDTFSPTTTKHQGVVRGVLERGMAEPMPRVIIPYSALQAASITLDSVQIVEVTADRWETRYERSFTEPTSAEWRYEYESVPGSGGWHHTKTDEWNCERPSWDRPKDAHPFEWDWSRPWGERDEAEALHERRHGHWEYVTPVRRNTGRRKLVRKRGWGEWELIDDPDSPTGILYERSFERHWLGESLVKGRVSYRGRRKCRTCAFTGEVEPYSEPFADDQGYGPLTRRQDYWMPDQEEYVRQVEAGRTDWNRLIRHRTVAATRMTTTCPECDGRRWVNAWKTREAYFLSGFDANESRPSYFFCELPKGARPRTVAEAYEVLKPDTVRLAESLGREVERQGDIFWIPMPDQTLRSLKSAGGQHIRRKVVLEPRMHWADGAPPSVLSTNHTVTEQVRIGRLTYARGTMRHEPDRRRPDHARIRLGDGKTWGLVIKNTVPTS